MLFKLLIQLYCEPFGMTDMTYLTGVCVFFTVHHSLYLSIPHVLRLENNSRLKLVFPTVKIYLKLDSYTRTYFR